MNILTILDIQRIIEVSLRGEDVVLPIYRREEAQYYPFLTILAKAVQPELIVELGTLDGRSTVHFAHGAPNSRVIGIDWNPPTNIDAYPNLNFWQGDTRLMSRQVAELGILISILFIDSEHQADCATVEFNAYWPLMRSSGILLVDDVYLNDMQEFWNNVVPEPKFIDVSLHSYLGFGIAIKE